MGVSRHLDRDLLAAATINQRLAAVRRLAHEARRFGAAESRVSGRDSKSEGSHCPRLVIMLGMFATVSTISL